MLEAGQVLCAAREAAVRQTDMPRNAAALRARLSVPSRLLPMREGHQAGALLSPFLLKKGWDEDAAEDRRHQIAFRDRSPACISTGTCPNQR
ncbi:hypothetical protein DGM98_13360 [Xanthomonas citri]|nr:hypothetical protein DGM98_13360 [Xanthomonas citri]